MPASSRRWAIQRGRGSDHDVAEHRHGRGAGRGRVDSTDRRGQPPSTGRPLARRRGRLGRREGEAQAGRPGRGRSPTMHQASGRLPSTVMSKTMSGSSPSASMSGVPGSPGASSPRTSSPAPSSVMPELACPSRACRWTQTPRILRRPISKPPGQDGADRGQRHPVADREVVRPADDLERRPAPASTTTRRIRSAPSIGVDLGDAADHDVLEPLADVLDRLDDQAEVVERGPQHPDVVGEGSEVTEPAERSAHGGRSFSLVG